MRIVFFDAASAPAETRVLMRQCRRRGDLIGLLGHAPGLAADADVQIRFHDPAPVGWRGPAVSAWCQRFGIEPKDAYRAIGSSIVPWEPSAG